MLATREIPEKLQAGASDAFVSEKQIYTNTIGLENVCVN